MVRAALALAMTGLVGCVLDFDIHGSGGEPSGGSTSEGPSTTTTATSTGSGGASGTSTNSTTATSTGTGTACEAEGGTCHPVVDGWEGPAAHVSAAACGVGLLQALLGGSSPSAPECPCELTETPCHSPQMRFYTGNSCSAVMGNPIIAGALDQCDPGAIGFAPVGVMFDPPPTPGAGTCALVTPTPGAVYAAPTSLCASASTCGPDDRCVAPVGTACVWRAGDNQPCPTGYLGLQQVITVASTQCGPCAGPSGATCDVGTVSFYDPLDTACAGAAATVATTPGVCASVATLGQTFQGQYNPTNPGSCAASAGSISASVLYTVCCVE